MKEKAIAFTYEARYYQLGEITENTTDIWLACHGYGQLAKYFLRRLEPLNQRGHVVLIPEGLHRFYLQGTGGRAGASWMTREDRLRDIENYLAYLNGLYKKEIASCATQCRIHLLGFSQGASTISRFAMQEEVSFDSLVLWAGVFPPDVDIDFARIKLRDKRVEVAYGDKDPYLTEENIAVLQKALYAVGVSPGEWPFEGEHDIDGSTLTSIAKALEKREG